MNRGVVLTIALLIVSLFTGLASGEEGTRESLPPPPVDVAAEPRDKEIRITWDYPAGTTGNDYVGFTLFKGTRSDNIVLMVASLGPFELSYLDSGLTNGNTYYYAVRSINQSGSSQLSDHASATPRGPASPPANVRTGHGSNYVNMSWDAPADTNGSPLEGYVVYRGMTENNITNEFDVGTDTEFMDRGLTNGVTYYYKLAAVTDFGPGQKTNVLALIPRTTPSAPFNLTLEAGDGEVTLGWNRSLEDGGSYIIGYRIFRGPSVEELGSVATVDDVTTYKDATVTNGVTYYYSVGAYNSEGVGDLSPARTVTPLGPPGKPLNVTLKPGDAQVTVSWEEPEIDGGTEILGYNIYMNVHGEDMELAADAGDVTEYTITDLTNGAIHYFQVKAYNSVGEGPGSATPMIRPEPVPKTPENFRIIDMEKEVKLVWSKPSYSGEYPYRTINIYRGVREDDIGFYTNISADLNNYYDTEVEVGTVYHYEISIVSVIGEGLRTPTVVGRPFGRPSVPLSFQVEAGNGKAYLTWDPPVESGGRVIDGFKIFRGTSSDALTLLDSVGGTRNYFNDTGLTNGLTYHYRISAFNKEMEGNATGMIEVIPTGPPEDPRSVKGSFDEQNGTIEIEWDDPEGDGGEDVLAFRVYRGLERNNLTFYKEVEAGEDFVDEDVEMGIGYFYYISAVNSEGEGTPSSIIYVEVPVGDTSGDGEGGSPLLWIALVGVAALIMIVIIIVAVVQSGKKKKKEEEEEVPQLEESEAEREERLIRERRKMMEQYTGVSTTTEDAHLHDHDKHEFSYEDLYGKSSEEYQDLYGDQGSPETGEIQTGEVESQTSSQAPREAFKEQAQAQDQSGTVPQQQTQ